MPDLRGFGSSWLRPDLLSGLPRRIAVGWSGGADSTALLLALRQAGLHVHAWHVDHGWRPESAREARLLADRAKKWGVAFASTRLAPAPASNLEARARAQRLACFEQWASESGVTTVALAHQRDDQAETVCMRLLQGASVAGCCGMAEERRHGGLRLVRPLLDVPGEELRLELRRFGIPWLEDRTNHDMRFLRNRIRHRLFPAIADAGQEPAELFLRLQAVAKSLSGQLQREAGQLLAGYRCEDGAICLPWASWKNASPPQRAWALKQMIRGLLGEDRCPGRRHIELVEAWTRHSGLGGLDLSGCRLQRHRCFLHLRPAEAGLQGRTGERLAS